MDILKFPNFNQSEHVNLDLCCIDLLCYPDIILHLFVWTNNMDLF